MLNFSVLIKYVVILIFLLTTKLRGVQILYEQKWDFAFNMLSCHELQKNIILARNNIANFIVLFVCFQNYILLAVTPLEASRRT